MKKRLQYKKSRRRKTRKNIRKKRRRSRKKRGGGNWITINDLGRKFNINDFKVGQIIDMKMAPFQRERTNLEIVRLEDEELIYKFK